MRTTLPANLMPKKYRIKEFNGVFTIEKRIDVKKRYKYFWDRFFHGEYYTEIEHHTLTEDGEFKDVWKGCFIYKKFKSLDEAKEKLKEIISKTEIIYHNF